MKKQFLIFITILFFIPNAVFSQTDSNRAEDKKQIRQVIKNIAAAWAEADAVKFADNFTDDVDYTVWNGLQFKGREANIKGHQQIFDTIYKKTKVDLKIKNIRFLSDKIAAVQVHGEMFKDGKRLENSVSVVPLMIFVKEKGNWRIAILQNTPIIRPGELVVGRTSEQEERK